MGSRTLARLGWIVLAIFVPASHGQDATPTRQQAREMDDLTLARMAPVDGTGWRASEYSPRARAESLEPIHVLTRQLEQRLESAAFDPDAAIVLLGRFFEANPNQLAHMVLTRPRWPRGEAVRAQLWWHPFMWRDWDGMVRARLAGSDDPWTTFAYADSTPRRTMEERYPIVGTLSPDAAHGAFEIEVWTGVAWRAELGTNRSHIDMSNARVLWRGVGVDFDVVETIEEALPASPEAESESISKQLKPRLAVDEHGAVTLELRSIGWHIGREGGEDWALGARCEVVHDGAVVGRGNVVYPMVQQGVMASGLVSRVDFDIAWDGAPPDESTISQGFWSIRLIGDREVALVDVARDSCWIGDFETPVHGLFPREDTLRIRELPPNEADLLSVWMGPPWLRDAGE
ncbi:MAG: hypothetical protein RBS39_02700 [Phycisphaerales bacterium]|nr:hypothetical protein [Phycisphaerales bacterium]